MERTFYKYQGTGNDFILFDDREETFDANNVELINHLCDRKFGIGADGLMLLRNHEGYDFEMVYFNADGNPSTMCGNGGRCITQFASDLGLVGNTIRFIAVDGPHDAYLTDKGVKLKMIEVDGVRKDGDDYVMDTGSPHYVRFVTGLDQFDVFTNGRSVRNQPAYMAEGINVNFVELTADGIKARTYERGVEDETLSCGTGVTACAIATHLVRPGQNPLPIHTLGGDLFVSFEQHGNRYQEVFLEGPATFVFKGNIDV